MLIPNFEVTKFFNVRIFGKITLFVLKYLWSFQNLEDIFLIKVGYGKTQNFDAPGVLGTGTHKVPKTQFWQPSAHCKIANSL